MVIRATHRSWFLIMPDERFDTFPLIEDRFVALIPSGYPLAQQLYIDPAQLENCPFIMTMAGSRHQVELILKTLMSNQISNFMFHKF